MERIASTSAERLSASGLRAFFRIAEVWALSLAEQRAVLGGVAKQTVYNWKDRPQEARLSGDQLDRISYVLGIYKALHILFTRPEQANSWIRRENNATPFGGRPAADLMFGGRMEDLMRVRRYLDDVRGAW